MRASRRAGRIHRRLRTADVHDRYDAVFASQQRASLWMAVGAAFLATAGLTLLTQRYVYWEWWEPVRWSLIGLGLLLAARGEYWERVARWTLQRIRADRGLVEPGVRGPGSHRRR